MSSAITRRRLQKKISGDVTPTEVRKMFNMEVLNRYNEIKNKENE